MEYFLGLLTGVVFLIMLGLVLFIGYKLGKKKQPLPIEVDEKEQQRIKRYNDHFKELFSYDVDTALQRKKVE